MYHTFNFKPEKSLLQTAPRKSWIRRHKSAIIPALVGTAALAGLGAYVYLSRDRPIPERYDIAPWSADRTPMPIAPPIYPNAGLPGVIIDTRSGDDDIEIQMKRVIPKIRPNVRPNVVDLYDWPNIPWNKQWTSKEEPDWTIHSMSTMEEANRVEALKLLDNALAKRAQTLAERDNLGIRDAIAASEIIRQIGNKTSRDLRERYYSDYLAYKRGQRARQPDPKDYARDRTTRNSLRSIGDMVDQPNYAIARLATLVNKNAIGDKLTDDEYIPKAILARYNLRYT